MKKKLLVMASIMTLLSCSESDEINPNESIVLDSGYQCIENQNQSEIDIYKQWERAYNDKKTRTSYNSITIYGYKSLSVEKRKAYLGKELATRVGLYDQIYVGEIVTATQEVSISGLSSGQVLFAPLSTNSNCGLFPDFTNDELDLRGYSAVQKGDVITMATKTIHIISDLNGKNYNIWYPCQPAQLAWDYMIINK